ncbi:MAG: PilZ domain-containing protein [Candidatus Sumerlaeia bacterium]
MADKDFNEKRDSERIEYPVSVEFFLDADILPAECVDVSQTGIAFNSAEPFLVQMRIEAPEGFEQRQAQLIWAKPLPGGGTRFGMRFTDEPGGEDPKIEGI